MRPKYSRFVSRRTATHGVNGARRVFIGCEKSLEIRSLGGGVASDFRLADAANLNTDRLRGGSTGACWLFVFVSSRGSAMSESGLRGLGRGGDEDGYVGARRSKKVKRPVRGHEGSSPVSLRRYERIGAMRAKVLS